MLQKISIYILILLCFSACKKEDSVCKDENAINYNMEDQNGGSTCEYAIDINTDLYGKWKVLYHLVYKLPSNATLNSLISQYASLTVVDFEELYGEDYPSSEIEWAEFITGQLGLNYTEIETPEEAGYFMEIEYTTDHKVKYYMGSTLDNNLTHNWTQFDYDHIAYYNDFYNAAEEIDIVELEVLNQDSLHYRRVLKQGDTKLIEYRRCIKSE